MSICKRGGRFGEQVEQKGVAFARARVRGILAAARRLRVGRRARDFSRRQDCLPRASLRRATRGGRRAPARDNGLGRARLR